MTYRTCQQCAAKFTQDGPGRPRKFCTRCSPPGYLERNRAWGRRNRDLIEQRRREREAERRRESVAGAYARYLEGWRKDAKRRGLT